MLGGWGRTVGRSACTSLGPSGAMREALFVLNPVSPGHFGLLPRHCQSISLRHGWEPLLIATRPGDRAAEVAREVQDYVRRPGQKLVFAVGGDGTVRLCAHALAGTGAPLAVVPRGAANLFAAALGIPHHLDKALLTGFDGAQRAVDVAEADGHVFVAMAGMGIDAAVVGSTPRWMKQHMGWLGYAAAALPHLLEAPHEMTVHIDGGLPIVRRAQAVVVGNVGILPGNFQLLSGAQVDDGTLEVGVLEPRGPLGWLHIARRALLATGDGQFEQFTARSVSVHVPVPLPRQLDGDLIGPGTTLEVRVCPQALVVRLPSGAAAAPASE